MTGLTAACRWRRRLILAAAVSTVAVLLNTHVAPADDGPLVIGQRPKVDPLHFNTPSGWLELDFRHEADSESPKGAPKSTFSENRFQETVTLQDTGYFIHPNLFELTLSGTFGLQQDMDRVDGKGDQFNSILYDYDASALILCKEEAPITVYSRRSTSTIGRQFGPSLDSTLSSTGAVLDWRNKSVPTRIEVYRLDQEQRALDGSEHFTQTQNTATWHSDYRPSDRILWTWDYAFSTGDSNSDLPGAGGSSRNTFTTHDATLANQFDFGDKGRNSLSSTLNYFNESGTFDLSRLHYSEVLRLRHSDNFETSYRYTLDDQSTGGSAFGGATSDQLLQRGEAQFIHRLFRSLTTTGTVGTQRIDESFGGSTELFGRLAFEYVKEVPLGKFSAGLGLGYDQTRNEARARETNVINQPATFTDPLPVVLPGRNIVPGSLVVTDSTGTTIYRPGLDYVTRKFGDRVELDRELGGRISSGQAVLVDYRLAPQAANTVDTTTLSLSARYDFERGPLKGVGLYARFLDNDQTVSSDVPAQFVPDSLRDYVVGVDYRVWELRLDTSHEWHHSVISPYDQFRTDVRWVHPITRDIGTTLGLNYTRTHFLEESDQLNALTINASAHAQLSRDWSVTATVVWQDQSDKLLGKTNGLEEQIELRWSHRQTYVYVRGRNSTLNTRAQDTAYQTIEVGMRRNF